MQKRSNGKISFNFTNEQQERFTLLYEETRKLHPELIDDEIARERTKVILAHYIINEEKINKDMEDKEKELTIAFDQNILSEI